MPDEAVTDAPTASETPVWKGADALRDTIVPIESLQPFPGNPRRGDAAAVATSLLRFGQVKPVVVDGDRIVAGHHVVQAAKLGGWTHVAVVANEFGSEDEQRAFLLADNRMSDLGYYDTSDLVTSLQALADIDALDGTGYTPDDLDEHLARLMQETDVLPPPGEPAEPRDTDLHEIVLMLSTAQREQFETWLKIVAKERGKSGVSETVYEGMRVAALQLNQTGAPE